MNVEFDCEGSFERRGSSDRMMGGEIRWKGHERSQEVAS